ETHRGSTAGIVGHYAYIAGNADLRKCILKLLAAGQRMTSRAFFFGKMLFDVEMGRAENVSGFVLATPFAGLADHPTAVYHPNARIVQTFQKPVGGNQNLIHFSKDG